jgi:hypothetical protein
MTAVSQFLLLASSLLLATMPVVALVLFVTRIRKGGPWGTVLMAVSFVVGSCAGGALAWSSVPPDWSLPLRATMEAAVNAGKYGHAIEHAAENILAFVIFASVVAGTLCAGITAGSLKAWSTVKPMSPRRETSR